MPPDRPEPKQKILKPTVAVIVFVIIMLLVFSWFLTRGVEDDQDDQHGVSNSPVEQSPNQTNPNATGGRDGTGGNDISNDPDVETPSPAGGVDTNDVPAGGSSSE